MRIGSYELNRIKNDILRDLYQKSEDKLKERKTAIAKQSRELYLKPIQYLLDQLPAEMVCHDKEYCLRVKYAPNKDKTEILVDEKWEYKADTNIINPQSWKSGSSYYSSTPENTLHPELQNIAEELCKDILTLRAKKEEMTSYLVETTTKYTGSLQLRKAWNEHPSLCKHLPAEPVKVSRPKPAKKVSTPDRAVPESLKIQLTDNLLEDN